MHASPTATPRFSAGHGAGPGWSEAVEACLARLGAVPPGANLGFVYATDELAGDLTHLVARLRQATGVMHWVGTVGTGICASNREYYEEPAVAVMLGSFPTDSFRVFSPIRDSFHEFITTHGPWYFRDEPHFGIVHGDPRNPAVPQLITHLADQLNSAYLVGGLTSSAGHYAQIADQVTEGGLSGVLFAPRVKVASGLTQGCTPIGPVHVISECQRNIAIRIDDRPALDVFLEDIGEILARDLNKVAGYIFAGLPIRGTDVGDYLVRNLIGIDTRHRLLAIGDHLRVGDELMFCRRDGNSARMDLSRMVRDVKRRAGPAPCGAVYFSCLGRGRSLFGEHSEELELIAAELGSTPLVGFFCNGEISHNRLYGYTGVLTVFLESA
jgi:small ligand-binding sensory domain FIST